MSSFGYSDLTTDFNGGLGAVAGARIHDPGEYTALKATSSYPIASPGPLRLASCDA